jgi:hypothetical protein
MHVCPPLLPLDNPHAPHRSPECPDRSASAENRTAFAIRAGSSSSGQATAQPRLGAVQHRNPDAAAARRLNASTTASTEYSKYPDLPNLAGLVARWRHLQGKTAADKSCVRRRSEPPAGTCWRDAMAMSCQNGAACSPPEAANCPMELGGCPRAVRGSVRVCLYSSICCTVAF